MSSVAARRSTTAPRLAQRRLEHDPVRLVDLARLERSPRRPQLGARDDDRDARRAGATPTRLDPAGGERAEPRRREQRARGEDRRLPRRTSPPRARMLSPLTTASAISTSSVAHDDALDGDDRVGALRHDAARRDLDRLPGRERRARRDAPRPTGRRSRSVPGQIGRPDGVSVHRRARERRQVDERGDGLRQDPAGCATRAPPARSEAARRARERGQRLVDGQERGHAPHATPGIELHGVPSRRDLGRHPRPRRGAQRRPALRRARGRVRRRRPRPGRPSSSTTARPTARSARSTRLHDAHDNVRVVRLRRNFGKAAALDAGFGEAAGDIVVTIDGDLQDDPAEIPRLLAKLDEGYDLVSGWKTKRRDPITRRIPSKIFNAVAGQGLGSAPARHELRPQGLSRRGRRRACSSTASSTATSPSSLTTAATGSPSCRSTTARASTAARTTASSATSAASSTSSR